MTNGDASGITAERIRTTVRSVLADHPVSFAMLFGSSARGTMDDRSDVDLALEFDTHRPDDDGYSELYLRVGSELEDALPTDVDVVDVHTMTPQFASVAFDEGDVVVVTDGGGALLVVSEDVRAELERDVAGDPPSFENVRNRVAAAAKRLRNDQL